MDENVKNNPVSKQNHKSQTEKSDVKSGGTNISGMLFHTVVTRVQSVL